MKSFLKKYPGLLLTVVLAAAIACALPHCEHTPSYRPGGLSKSPFAENPTAFRHCWRKSLRSGISITAAAAGIFLSRMPILPRRR